MRNTKLIFSFFILLLLTTFNAPLKAADNLPEDSIRISLLTCAPGKPIYSLFGHTAIRYEHPKQNIDVVFNYGLFSFNTPNFILRFSLGETDYQLGVQPFDHFRYEYEYYGREVRQQTLNLTNSEKERLIELLKTNSLPQNRVYRYNFFYDNCATRPRDIIEQSISDTLNYAPLIKTGETKSFRDLIHQYTPNALWGRFGIDFCVGSEADRPITERQMMFIPFYLEDAYANAYITTEDSLRNLVTSTEIIVDNGFGPDEESTIEKIGSVMSPLLTFSLLFLIVLAATIYGIFKSKGLWGLDVFVFGLSGIAGCILAFLALFSEHPAVSSNYLLLVFHPGQLIFLPLIIRDVRRGKRCWYLVFNTLVLTLFIVLFPIIPQRFDFAVVPLALCLLVRSVSNLILTHKKN